MKNQQLKISLQSRMIAVQLKQARLRIAKSVQECAAFLSIPPQTYADFEDGTLSPSLPQLEALSYFFDTPLKRFLDAELTQETSVSPSKVKQLIDVRTKIIATKLQSLRKEKELSLKEVAQAAGISPAELKSFELAERKIPYVLFDLLCSFYGVNAFDFISQDNLIGELNSQKEAFKNFIKLPAELRAFVSKPINEPYLELAKKLSTTDVEKLRSLAENLLEITL